MQKHRPNRQVRPACLSRNNINLIILFKEKCRKHRVCGTFGVFRFLLSRGTIVHLPSQENEIQNLSQQPAACRKHFFDTLWDRLSYPADLFSVVGYVVVASALNAHHTSPFWIFGCADFAVKRTFARLFQSRDNLTAQAPFLV